MTGTLGGSVVAGKRAMFVYCHDLDRSHAINDVTKKMIPVASSTHLQASLQCRIKWLERKPVGVLQIRQHGSRSLVLSRLTLTKCITPTVLVGARHLPIHNGEILFFVSSLLHATYIDL